MLKVIVAAVALTVVGLVQAQQPTTIEASPPLLSMDERQKISEAVGNAKRSITNVMRDAHRNPEGTLEFFAVKADHTVVEVWPGAGWYTEILASLVREDGRLIAAHFDPDSPNEYLRKSRAEFETKMDEGRGDFDKVEMAVLNYEPGQPIAEPGTADRVLTFRNVHNWLAAGREETEVVFSKLYEVLKPGGMLGLVEHRARPGLSLENMVKTGYVSEDLVVELAQGAGFELLSRSPINQNPQDSTDHPEGVWSLPPTLRNAGENRAHNLAIGESDRMTLLFIKQ
ncbi:MAG TPA: methyltransferase [Pseudomonas xinjiangensis]|uniref:Methyltransferase n=2 Tax=root TaxID=1 RepID=A0A7V1FT23_9GAMM|nr:methyltransferase [Halopseudomonas xinjiangensis]HEC47482.1 methyltransferase [Halopseudomonas xinjiangensis]